MTRLDSLLPGSHFQLAGVRDRRGTVVRVGLTGVVVRYQPSTLTLRDGTTVSTSSEPVTISLGTEVLEV